MKSKNAIIVVIVLVVVAGGGLLLAKSNKKTDSTTKDTSTSNSSNSSANADPNTVILDKLDFQTKSLTVKKGTTVTWKNNDTAKHTITFDDTAMSSADSQLFGTGETYTHTFDTAGTFAYHCTPHPFMKGTIVVTE